MSAHADRSPAGAAAVAVLLTSSGAESQAVYQARRSGSSCPTLPAASWTRVSPFVGAPSNPRSLDAGPRFRPEVAALLRFTPIADRKNLASRNGTSVLILLQKSSSTRFAVLPQIEILVLISLLEGIAFLRS